MPLYSVKMWLSVNNDDPDVLADFDERFPRSLEREWASFLVNAADEAALRTDLNQRIFTRCETALAAEYAPDTVALGQTFLGGSWTVGTGGQHEGKTAVRVNVGAVPTLKDWTIGGGLADPIISASVLWDVA